VYAVGLVLYCCLARRLPWSANTVADMLHAHARVEPRRLPSLGLPARPLCSPRLYSPSNIIVVDKAVNRLQIAKELGAHTITTPDTDLHELVHAATGGLGAETVMEAIGTPATFELWTTLVRPSGRIANIGVHGKPAVMHLKDLWIRDVTLTTGLVDIVEAYDTFSRAADTGRAQGRPCAIAQRQAQAARRRVLHLRQRVKAMTQAAVRRAPRPTIGEFAGQLAAVAADIPLFLTSPLYRWRHPSVRSGPCCAS
jgi:hypothetical protein